ncbi:hypothetical protein BTHERMOSOX_808 [Bathymodiolus thermophilus thioautotrophic gill symbiont]|uniref:hypothetical protein n=1 Tax=Bathymodiolus thermophilus thioautotrophic gill symbiont TaxID=2360 RepID=UPI0010B4D014|nr:hypothetical protein [Bathymodiolus thermophilus thioautotrophic gill symbiont]SHA05612.1 hypothetical protein BTHERMOSOX_808 [Bathymodiolus thermophilus thioautotrophic gill symbiont]
MKRNKVKLIAYAKIAFYIDEKNKDEILNFLKEKGGKKLQNILLRIKEETATRNVYSSENYNDDIENITAIKFKGKVFNNARIYCKDYYDNKLRIIVLSELLISKKQTKLKHKERNLINKVNDYDY